MIKMKIMYEASDGKLFENESKARQYELLRFNVKYYYFRYNKNWQAELKEEKIGDNEYDPDEYENPIEKALVEAEVIFIPNMEVLNEVCAFAPEFMPDFDSAFFVPQPGFYAWVENENCFMPVNELYNLPDEELNNMLWLREDLDKIKELERSNNLEVK